MGMRSDDKRDEIEKYLAEFESIMPLDFEEYKKSIKQKAYSERYFEKIVEAVIDLTYILIKEKGLKISEDDQNSFNILRDNKIISEVTCEKLKLAKGMRNVISHEYGTIDDRIVFNSVTKNLIRDVKRFLEEIGNEKIV